MRVFYALLILLVAGRALHAEEPAGVRLEAQGTLRAGSERVRSLAWTPDGTRLAAGDMDRTMRIYDMRPFELRTTKSEPAEPVASNTLPRYG